MQTTEYSRLRDIPIRYVLRVKGKKEISFRLLKTKPKQNPLYGAFDEKKQELVWCVDRPEKLIRARSAKKEHLIDWVERETHEDYLDMIRIVPIYCTPNNMIMVIQPFMDATFKEIKDDGDMPEG